MSSPTRTRARKTAQSKAKAGEPKPISQEEATMAAMQENEQFMNAQMQYLQGRVASLRVELNRANAEIERLRGEDQEVG